MTALKHPAPRRPRTEAEVALTFELRGLAHAALAYIEVHDLKAAERCFRDALETAEAAR
jgi:hypothetical protein